MTREKDSLVREVQTDKANLAKLQSRIAAKQEQADKSNQNLAFFEQKLDSYDTLIQESEEVYSKVKRNLTKILENAGRLVTVIHEQCDRLESKLIKPTGSSLASTAFGQPAAPTGGR